MSNRAFTNAGSNAGMTTSEPLIVVPLKHYGRWCWAALTLLLAVAAMNSIVNNANFEWSLVAHYLTSATVLAGVWMTIKLTVLSLLLGFAGGAVLALMRLSSNPVLVAVSWTYTWLFRAVPLLVQLFLWYNVAALYPHLAINLPWVGLVWSAPMNSIISPFSAAVLALVLHQAAYAAEIIRAGILGIGSGQNEAAKALGFDRWQTMSRIVLPQAMRTILPPAGNEVIGQLKTTAVVSVIALQDLLYSVQIIYQRTYEVIPLLMVATLWYIAMTSVLSIGQYIVERHFGRGVAAQGRAPWEYVNDFLGFKQKRGKI
ncbi:amino acid ABC transporter permease [Vreelandella nigrificans]|nr:amino acid ABC transporter permease [Halomonas nigrificans]